MVSLYEILDEMTISFTGFGRLIMTQFMAAMLQKKLPFKASIAWIVGQPFSGSGKSREQWSGTGGGGGASLEDVKKMKRKIRLHLRWCRPKSKPTEQLNCCDPDWYWDWREAAWQKQIHILLKRWKESRTELRLHPASCLNSSRTWQASATIFPPFSSFYIVSFQNVCFYISLLGWIKIKGNHQLKRKLIFPTTLGDVSFWEGISPTFDIRRISSENFSKNSSRLRLHTHPMDQRMQVLEELRELKASNTSLQKLGF